MRGLLLAVAAALIALLVAPVFAQTDSCTAYTTEKDCWAQSCNWCVRRECF
jgi:hypothetical protein